MSVEDRFLAAHKAAVNWSPNKVNQDPEIIWQARIHFAEGYAAALSDYGLVGRVPGPIEPRERQPPEREWPVAPC